MSDVLPNFTIDLEPFLKDLLLTHDERWVDWDPAHSTRSEECSILLLTAAGMLERQVSFRMR